MRSSAGILIYREAPEIQVLLVHPGGPFWKNKDAGAWTIPKGEFDTDEEPLTAAVRELKEEAGLTVDGEFAELGTTRMKSGKTIHAWAISADPSLAKFESNTFELEWPPKSGKMIQVPEVDKIEWYSLPNARLQLNPAQVIFIDRLEEMLSGTA